MLSHPGYTSSQALLPSPSLTEIPPVDNSEGHCLCVKEAKGGGLALQWVMPKLVLLRPDQVFLFPDLDLQTQHSQALGSWRVHLSSPSMASDLERKGGSVPWTQGTGRVKQMPICGQCRGCKRS